MLINEDNKSDEAQRIKAERYYEGIKKFLDDNKDALLDNPKEFEYKNIIQKKDNDYFLFPENMKTMELSFPNLILLFKNKSFDTSIKDAKAKAGFGTVGKYKVIILSGILYNEDTPFAFINTRFSGYKNLFIHEMIHYLDERYKLSHKFKKKQDSQKFSSYKDYLNSPLESNAHYQEFTSKLNSLLKNKKLSDTITSWDEYFYLAQITHKELFQFLRKKYKRQFIKRLYANYEQLKKDGII